MTAQVAVVDPAIEPKLNARLGFRAYRIRLAGPGDPSPVVAQVHLQGAVGPDGGAYSPPPAPGDDHLMPICTLPDGWRPKAERWFTVQVSTYIRMHTWTPTLCVVRPDGVVAIQRGTLAFDGAVFFDGVSFLVER